MNSNELKLAFGKDKAEHLIFGNSLVKNWAGSTSKGLEYGVYARSGATLSQLLEDVETVLSGIPEEDEAGRTCIVQVII